MPQKKNPDVCELIRGKTGRVYGDLMTLLTCTPYGVNTERLLVRGHRVPYKEAYSSEKDSSISLETNYILWVVIGLLLTAALIGGMYVRERKKKHEA